MSNTTKDVICSEAPGMSGIACFSWSNNPMDSEWIKVSSSVKVGDKGKIEYHATKSHGSWVFIPEKNEESGHWDRNASR